MFIMRGGAVPLRTTDGGSSWTELNSTAKLFQYGASYDASLSWTGKTFVLTGTDHSAVGRQEYGTIVWKSTDDGDTWTDETGDIVTMGAGMSQWYEDTLYLSSAGEGIFAKKFE